MTTAAGKTPSPPAADAAPVADATEQPTTTSDTDVTAEQEAAAAAEEAAKPKRSLFGSIFRRGNKSSSPVSKSATELPEPATEEPKKFDELADAPPSEQTETKPAVEDPAPASPKEQSLDDSKDKKSESVPVSPVAESKEVAATSEPATPAAFTNVDFKDFPHQIDAFKLDTTSSLSIPVVATEPAPALENAIDKVTAAMKSISGGSTSEVPEKIAEKSVVSQTVSVTQASVEVPALDNAIDKVTAVMKSISVVQVDEPVADKPESVSVKEEVVAKEASISVEVPSAPIETSKEEEHAEVPSAASDEKKKAGIFGLLLGKKTKEHKSEVHADETVPAEPKAEEPAVVEHEASPKDAAVVEKPIVEEAAGVEAPVASAEPEPVPATTTTEKKEKRQSMILGLIQSMTGGRSKEEAPTPEEKAVDVPAIPSQLEATASEVAEDEAVAAPVSHLKAAGYGPVLCSSYLLKHTGLTRAIHRRHFTVHLTGEIVMRMNASDAGETKVYMVSATSELFVPSNPKIEYELIVKLSDKKNISLVMGSEFERESWAAALNQVIEKLNADVPKSPHVVPVDEAKKEPEAVEAEDVPKVEETPAPLVA